VNARNDYKIRKRIEASREKMNFTGTEVKDYCGREKDACRWTKKYLCPKSKESIVPKKRNQQKASAGLQGRVGYFACCVIWCEAFLAKMKNLENKDDEDELENILTELKSNLKTEGSNVSDISNQSFSTKASYSDELREDTGIIVDKSVQKDSESIVLNIDDLKESLDFIDDNELNEMKKLIYKSELEDDDDDDDDEDDDYSRSNVLDIDGLKGSIPVIDDEEIQKLAKRLLDDQTDEELNAEFEKLEAICKDSSEDFEDKNEDLNHSTWSTDTSSNSNNAAQTKLKVKKTKNKFQEELNKSALSTANSSFDLKKQFIENLVQQGRQDGIAANDLKQNFFFIMDTKDTFNVYVSDELILCPKGRIQIWRPTKNKDSFEYILSCGGTRKTGKSKKFQFESSLTNADLVDLVNKSFKFLPDHNPCNEKRKHTEYQKMYR
jgi:hypothetical protein